MRSGLYKDDTHWRASNLGDGFPNQEDNRQEWSNYICVQFEQ